MRDQEAVKVSHNKQQHYQTSVAFPFGMLLLATSEELVVAAESTSRQTILSRHFSKFTHRRLRE